jgi:hypothetical protein
MNNKRKMKKKKTDMTFTIEIKAKIINQKKKCAQIYVNEKKDTIQTFPGIGGREG